MRNPVYRIPTANHDGMTQRIQVIPLDALSEPPPLWVRCYRLQGAWRRAVCDWTSGTTSKVCFFLLNSFIFAFLPPLCAMLPPIPLWLIPIVVMLLLEVVYILPGYCILFRKSETAAPMQLANIGYFVLSLISYLNSA
jgi:hypothetical protein